MLMRLRHWPGRLLALTVTKVREARHRPATTNEAQKCEVCLKVLLHIARTLRESLYGACFRNGPSSTHTQGNKPWMSLLVLASSLSH
jgi:hypothetical protein